MKCPRCDSPHTKQKHGRAFDPQRTPMAYAMNTPTRAYSCQCGFEFTTSEVDDAELSRLRQLAHRAVMFDLKEKQHVDA